MVLLLWLIAHWTLISSIFAAVVLTYGMLKGWTRLVTFFNGLGYRFTAAEETIHTMANNHLAHIQETSHLTVLELQKMNARLENMSEYTRLLIEQKIDAKE